MLVLAATPSAANAEPLSDSTFKAISEAISKNWVIPIGVTNAERYTVLLRLYMTPQGFVTKIEVLGDQHDAGFRTLAGSARRAVMITQSEDGRLPIPADEYAPTIVLRWPMKRICEERGGC